MKKAWQGLFCMICGTVLFISCGNKKNQRATANNSPVFQQPALKDISAKIESSPTDAALYYQRGQLLHKMAQDSLALNDYKKATTLDSTKSEYYSAVADVLFDHKDVTGSIPWLQKAVKLNPDDPKAHLKIAKLFLFTRDYRSTFTEINTVLKQNAFNPEAYWLKGMAYKEMRDTAHAISSFETAVEVDPDYREAILQLGQMYTAKRNPVALKYYDNAYKLDTSDVLPLFARGVFFQSLNDTLHAKEEYRRCIVKDNQYADAYFNLGWLLLQQDSTDKAWRQYDYVTKIEPNNSRAYYNRGLCSEIMNRKTDAVNDYRQALVFDTSYAEPIAALKRLGVSR